MLRRLFRHSADLSSVLRGSKRKGLIMDSAKALDACKKAAAVAAVNELVEDNQAIGIGSGSTIVHAVERLAERVKQEGLKITCVPTSFQARQLILDNGLVLTDLDQTPQLDLAIDGADLVDSKLTLIKGGGGCHTLEKIIADSSKKFAVVADYSKLVDFFGHKKEFKIPVEVLSVVNQTVKIWLEGKGGKAMIRPATSKMGPTITDNGNFILDWHFPQQAADICDWAKIAQSVKQKPGVIETGLFVDMADVAYVGESDGRVTKINKGKVKK